MEARHHKKANGRRGVRGSAGLVAPALAAAGVLSLAGCGGLATPSADLFPTPARDAVTFWGHACVYIDAGGVGVVTDPVFERSVAFRHRRLPSPPPSSYAGCRVVLISHAHPDHLSVETLRTFPDDVVIVCPAPCAKYLDGVEKTVRVARPGDVMVADDIRITAVAAHHTGSRWGVDASADGRALGYVVEARGTTIFYSGDSDYFSGFSHVGRTFAPDVAVLNVNGHLPGTDATRAAWATGAALVVPTHWGGFGYWVVGGNRRPRDEDTLRRVVGDRLHVLEVGQALPFAAPSRAEVR